MTKKLQYGRALWLTLLVCAAFAGLGYRLVDLQVLRHDELSTLAEQNTQREFFREPRRGDILDARGNLLATSIFVKTVCADPTLIGNHQVEVARALAPLLQMNENELYQKLLPRVRQNEKGETITNRYVVLKHKVTEDNWQQIQLAMSRLSFGDESKLAKSQREYLRDLRAYAVFTDPINDQLRIYPNGALASQVLGFVGEEELMVDGHSLFETSGRDGIERILNSELSGVSGWRVTATDRQQRELVALRDQDVQPRDGLNVELTIDSVIQHIVETALANAMKEHTPLSVCGIVVRPQTGEILAMVSLPNFDPNNLNTVSPETRNRCITDVMEPGSTFKIVVVSGALNDHVVRLSDTFNCEEGHFYYGGRTLHDHEPFGILTTESIITKSSNIGAAKIGIKLGDERLYDYARDFGFGEQTGIPLPGEVRGILYPVSKWSKVSIAQIPMGHGVAVTRLQMVMAMSAIANNGELMHPMLVRRLEDRAGNVVAQYSPQPVRQVVSPETAKLMVEALKTVPTPEGTAPGAAMKNYVVAGKTGTAQKAENGAYAPGKYIASFIGFFPADDPQLCISVVMDEPKEGYYGGQVCGPVFREIAEQCASYLGIPPDNDLQRQQKSPLSIASARMPSNP